MNKINHQASERDKEKLRLVEKDRKDETIANKSGHIRYDINTERGFSRGIFLESESVEEHRDSCGEGSGEEDQEDASNFVVGGEIEEAVIVEEEPDVVLGPDVKELREVG